ncbi:hypothetical protein KLP40_20970 [Hymenobacter sp. NST-14]|uniref:hypothetical protein n=1 Tax=Hymenobacter piscis TaxID=2839984 RepID=UPI001C019EA2|nr:hypothetical protein [Hymenobacter piscis]MBT9395649.1 hypothetical protein [Hymenobacter piscis]
MAFLGGNNTGPGSKRKTAFAYQDNVISLRGALHLPRGGGPWCTLAGPGLAQHVYTQTVGFAKTSISLQRMLLPLFGFVFGVVASTLLAAAVIALHPRWKLTFANIAWFVGGAFAGAIGSSLLYTRRVFADENRLLQSTAAVIGFLATLGAATLLGGTLAVYMGQRSGSRAA